MVKKKLCLQHVLDGLFLTLEDGFGGPEQEVGHGLETRQLGRGVGDHL